MIPCTVEPLANEMARLLDEAMEVFKAYLNVPEATALREKWERLKN